MLNTLELLQTTEGPGLLLTWGPFAIQIGNLIVITVMIVLFFSPYCCRFQMDGDANEHSRKPVTGQPREETTTTRAPGREPSVGGFSAGFHPTSSCPTISRVTSLRGSMSLAWQPSPHSSSSSSPALC